jgi:hypothetical protein
LKISYLSHAAALRDDRAVKRGTDMLLIMKPRGIRAVQRDLLKALVRITNKHNVCTADALVACVQLAGQAARLVTEGIEDPGERDAIRAGFIAEIVGICTAEAFGCEVSIESATIETAEPRIVH